MTITLDDVACLTRLPIDGVFFSLPNYSSHTAATVASETFDISLGEMLEQVGLAKGPSPRLTYLRGTLIPRSIGAGQMT